MPVLPARSFLDRLVVIRCRLTYAQQRIRELEALIEERGVEIPATVTRVPPPDHRCVP